MRVIGGRCKGRRLVSFKGRSIRPTSDKVREAVFNTLGPSFGFEKVLDLFAGTGAMGMEALSRGASEAAFVDSDGEAVSVIKKNLELCGFSEEARVIKRDVVGALRHLSLRGESFDLIFIDPPYGEPGLAEEALKAIEKGGLLTEGGFIVVEMSKRTPLETTTAFKLYTEKKYGDTFVYFLTTWGNLSTESFPQVVKK